MRSRREISPRDLLGARLVVRALVPMLKVLLEEDAAMARRFRSVNAAIQFSAAAAEEKIGVCLVFDHGQLHLDYDLHDAPTVAFDFRDARQMRAFFKGKPLLPQIRGKHHPILIYKTVRLLMALQLMLPTLRPETEALKILKVRLMLYMSTLALSQFNKGGDPEMAAWTRKQPERVYQFSVEPEGIAAYLKVKGGKSRAGRGLYTRRRPFVHMKFNGVEAALAVLLKEVEFVAAVGDGMVEVVGAPEYAAQLGDFMMRIQTLVAGGGPG